MNKQLRQFEKESKLEIFGLGAKRHIWEAALEKYAELIVRECAEMVRIQNEQFMANESHYGVVSADILKHFGVEE